jgi:hypothetical protein
MSHAIAIMTISAAATAISLIFKPRLRLSMGLRHHPFDTLSLKVVEFRPLNLGDRSFGHFAKQPTHLAINLILS